VRRGRLVEVALQVVGGVVIEAVIHRCRHYCDESDRSEP
jgi:hypothetical protein